MQELVASSINKSFAATDSLLLYRHITRRMFTLFITATFDVQVQIRSSFNSKYKIQGFFRNFSRARMNTAAPHADEVSASAPPAPVPGMEGTDAKDPVEVAGEAQADIDELLQNNKCEPNPTFSHSEKNLNLSIVSFNDSCRL